MPRRRFGAGESALNGRRNSRKSFICQLLNIYGRDKVPFAAFCKKCGKYLIDHSFGCIQGSLGKHFQDQHGQIPHPNIYFVDFNRDFKVNDVELESDNFRPYTFQSKLFDSKSYCIAVIIGKDFENLQRDLTEKDAKEGRETAELTLYPYFPIGYDSTPKE